MFTVPSDPSIFIRKAAADPENLRAAQRAHGLRAVYFPEVVSVTIMPRSFAKIFKVYVTYGLGKKSNAYNADFGKTTEWPNAIKDLTVFYAIPQSFGFRLTLRKES